MFVISLVLNILGIYLSFCGWLEFWTIWILGGSAIDPHALLTAQTSLQQGSKYYLRMIKVLNAQGTNIVSSQTVQIRKVNNKHRIQASKMGHSGTANVEVVELQHGALNFDDVFTIEFVSDFLA